jgi:hypothetical protein
VPDIASVSRLSILDVSGLFKLSGLKPDMQSWHRRWASIVLCIRH